MDKIDQYLMTKGIWNYAISLEIPRNDLKEMIEEYSDLSARALKKEIEKLTQVSNAHILEQDKLIFELMESGKQKDAEILQLRNQITSACIIISNLV